MLSAAAGRLALFAASALLILAGAAGAAVTRDELDASVQREILLAHPHRFSAGDSSVTLRPRELRLLVRVRGDELVVDTARLGRTLSTRFPDRPARDARLRVEGDRVVVVPGIAARSIDGPATAKSLLDVPGALEHPVRFHRTPPEVTTAELAALRITELVSEFTTHYPPGRPRVTNIKRAAELLDGTILARGQTFSMNAALGERTATRGFVAAPTILGGRLVDSIGGGISQVATTLYNAAFFAGLDLIEHTPHSFYIDRYPMGREATISWGGPELVFRNDWDAALLMKLVASETSITVRFYSSSLGRRVETTTSDPYRWTAPSTVEVSDTTLEPGERVIAQEAGAAGFDVDYTRRVYARDRLLRSERFHVRYVPQNAIVLVGVAPVSHGSRAEP
jgi:vancomycin resistance protein YoaR